MARDRKGALFIQDGYATLAHESETGEPTVVTTTYLNKGCNVRIDDGHRYPPMCEYGNQSGALLNYSSDAALARDCCARLFKTMTGFNRAVAAMTPGGGAV